MLFKLALKVKGNEAIIENYLLKASENIAEFQ
jgi:hypothetical protein